MRIRHRRVAPKPPATPSSGGEAYHAQVSPHDPASWLEPWARMLTSVDAAILPDLSNLSNLLTPLPLAIWGAALLQPDLVFPHSNHLLPVMPPDEVQDRWTGNHGAPLLNQSIQFIRQVTSWLGACGIDVTNARGMDFGVGWGRLARLWLKFAPPQGLLCADAWQRSLDQARECRLPNRLVLTDEVLVAPPIDNLDFIWSYSVFSHLDELAFSSCLRALAGSLRPGGALIFTVRPHEYWRYHKRQPWDPDPLPTPAPDEPFVHGHHDRQDTTHWGDTTVTAAWISDQCQRCGLASPRFEWSPSEPFWEQVVVLTQRR
jgi:SAM-dependent methyltransferase